MSDGGLLPIVTGAASDASKPFSEAVGKSLADVWQGIVGDRVAAWRINNAADISKKLDAKLAAKNMKIERDKISDRYAFTWFEEASKQDEPEIQELFAQLLLNASQGDSDALDRRHLSTLSQFTPIDALVFDRLFYPKNGELRIAGIVPSLPRWSHQSMVSLLARELGDQAPNSLEHLINLGVLARGFKLETGVNTRMLGSGGPAVNLTVNNEIIATGLGWSLHLALKNTDDQ
jgi:hypothetical protein